MKMICDKIFNKTCDGIFCKSFKKSFKKKCNASLDKSCKKNFDTQKICGNKAKFSVSPVALLIWLWLFVVLGHAVALAYLLAILVHEMAHVLVARWLGYKTARFAVTLYGFSLDYSAADFDFRDEIRIAFAGPAANLFCAFFMVSLWWIEPELYAFSADFVAICVLLALSNLLPAYPLDGGRIFVDVASFFLPKKIARRVTFVFNLCLAAVFFVLFFVSIFVNFNPTLLLFGVFLVGGALELSAGSVFEKVNVFSKKTKNFAKAQVLMLTQSATIGEVLKKVQSGKTHLFCLVLENGKVLVLSEQMIVNLSLAYGIGAKLGDVLVKKV